MPEIREKIKHPTITKRSDESHKEFTDESPLLPLQNNPVMPLSSERPPIESPGAQPVTEMQKTRTFRMTKSSIAGDLHTEQIKEPEREKERANSGGTIGGVTTWKPFAIFRRNKKVGDKESQGADDYMAAHLKTLQASLANLVTSPKLKDQELGQLRSRIVKAMNALPQTERPAAWQGCLKQVINSESHLRLDSTVELQSSGWGIRYAWKANQHSTTCRGLALAVITWLISELPIGERLKPWGQIKEFLDDPNNRLMNEDIKRVASVLVAQTQGLWPEEGCGWTHEAILRRMDDAILTMETNNHGKPLEPYILSRVVSALMHIPRKDFRMTWAIEHLQFANFHGELPKDAKAKLLTQYAELVGSLGYPTTQEGFLLPTTKYNYLEPSREAFPGGMHRSEPSAGDTSGRRPVISAGDSPADENPKLPCVKAIEHLLRAIAPLEDPEKQKLVEELINVKPTEERCAKYEAVCRAALNYTPRAEDMSQQNVLVERAKMLGIVFKAAETLFGPAHGSSSHIPDSFPSQRSGQSKSLLPKFHTGIVWYACNLVSALPDGEPKLNLLKQLVEMASWLKSSFGPEFNMALKMIDNEIKAIPPEFPGRKDLLDEFQRKHVEPAQLVAPVV